MKATPQQLAAIKRLTHNANQIIDRAIAGQKEHLQYNVKAMTGSNRFSTGRLNQLSYEQAAKKLEDLNKFYDAKSVFKAGWRDIVEKAVDTANVTLNKMGFDLTNAELAETLKQLNDIQTADKYVGLNAQQKRAQKRREFYEAVEKVQANKARGNWEGSAQDIGEALAQQLSAQQSLTAALNARNANR